MAGSMQSYESLLDVCIASAMGTLKNMTYEELNTLLNDDEKLDSIIDNIPHVRNLPSEREMGLVQNKSLAEWNLSQEPILEEVKTKIYESYDEAVALRDEIVQLNTKIDSLSEQRSIDSCRALLQAAAQTADDESEAIAENFLNGVVEVEEFSKDFLEKKAMAHMRKVKFDKLSALLRGQYYSPASNSAAVPYPINERNKFPGLPTPSSLRS